VSVDFTDPGWTGDLTVSRERCAATCGDRRDGQSAISNGSTARPNIVHVSGDFPDPFDGFKTPVIRDLVELTSDSFRHDVVSINRHTPGARNFLRGLVSGAGRPSLHTNEQPFAYGTALTYEAPSRGIFHATMLRELGDRLADKLLSQGRADLLVGHKLSIEGIVVRRAALRLDVPYAICLQGDTDTKILAARPDLRGEFRKIYRDAAMVFPFAPWTQKACEAYLGERRGPVEMLPCPTDLDVPLPPCSSGEGLLSVFHLKNHRRKNLRGLASAMRCLEAAGQRPRLAIVGGGGAQDLAHCKALTRGVESIEFEGALDRGEMRRRMNSAKGFVLPSLRESFGLVFIEALFAGLPIIYPEGAAVDGYFDGCSFAIPVNAGDPQAIAAAMDKLVRDEAYLKSDLLDWQNSAHAKRFTRSAIARTFRSGLNTCLEHS